MSQDDKDHWLVRRSTIRGMWVVFILLLAGVTALDLVVHHHAYFGVDGTFGFGSWYGFIACVVLVVFSKGVGMILKRRDTYYDG